MSLLVVLRCLGIAVDGDGPRIADRGSRIADRTELRSWFCAV